jgi:methylated-DNA-[protein]-cysteine S-methyltransferase
MTYGAVARALDLPSPRQAGALLKANPQPDFFPCYKVVRSDGHLGGYVLGTPEKIKRLRAEGILIKNNRVINFDRVRYAMMTEDAQHLRTTTT